MVNIFKSKKFLKSEKEEEEVSSSDDEEEAREVRNPVRRISVSAESMSPEDQAQSAKVVIPKTDDQKRRIEVAIQNNFLFKNLDSSQQQEVIDAMFEKTVAAGEDIIKQGAKGDFFYIIDSGAFDVYVAKGGAEPVKVVSYTAGASFGELALMYNAPRAATVRATTDSIVWALDRTTFRRMLMESAIRKRKMYEKFLEEVPLLLSLEPYERHKIADALESVEFEDGEVVIKQGDIGTRFFFIEDGQAVVTQVDDKGKVKEVAQLKKGNYFGELALLTDKPRAATVTAKGRLRCATLNKGGFTRLLGPCLDILKRNMNNYAAISAKNGIPVEPENTEGSKAE